MNIDVRSLILTDAELEEMDKTSREELARASKAQCQTEPVFESHEPCPHVLVVERIQGGKVRWRLNLNANTRTITIEGLTRKTTETVFQPKQLASFFRGVIDPIETECPWLPALYPDIKWRRALIMMLRDETICDLIKRDRYRLEGEKLKDHRYPQSLDWVENIDQCKDRPQVLKDAFQGYAARMDVIVPWQKRHAETRGDVTEPEVRYIAHMAPALDTLAETFGVPWVRFWLEETCRCVFDVGHTMSFTSYGCNYASSYAINGATNDAQLTAEAAICDLRIAGFDLDHPGPMLISYLVRGAVHQGYAEAPLAFFATWAQCLRWQREVLGYIEDEEPRNIRSKILALTARAQKANARAFEERADAVERTLGTYTYATPVNPTTFKNMTEARRDAIGWNAAGERAPRQSIGEQTYTGIVNLLPMIDADVVAYELDGEEYRALLPASTDRLNSRHSSTRSAGDCGHPFSAGPASYRLSPAPYGLWRKTENGWTTMIRLDDLIQMMRNRRFNNRGGTDAAISVYATMVKRRYQDLGLNAW